MLTATIRTLIISAALASANIAYAGVVTFDSFSNGPFSSGTEDGFTIAGSGTTVFNGIGLPGKAVGVPGPNSVASLTFSNGDVFRFESLDLFRPNFGALTQDVMVTGYLNGSQLGTDTFSVAIPASTLTTYAAVNLAGITLDSLVISLNSSSLNTPIIDNVTFATGTPEPDTLLLLGSGLVSCIFLRKRLGR